MLAERREKTGHEGGIIRISCHAAEPVVEIGGHYSDYRRFQVATERQVTRHHEQLEKMCEIVSIIRCFRSFLPYGNDLHRRFREQGDKGQLGDRFIVDGYTDGSGDRSPGGFEIIVNWDRYFGKFVRCCCLGMDRSLSFREGEFIA